MYQTQRGGLDGREGVKEQCNFQPKIPFRKEKGNLGPHPNHPPNRFLTGHHQETAQFRLDDSVVVED